MGYTAALSTVFTDKSKLRPDYIPPRIVHRTDQLRKVERNLSDALRNLIPVNFLTYGMPGTGKTSVVGSVANDLQRRGAPQVRFVTLNCSQTRHEYSIYQAVSKLTGQKYRLSSKNREVHGVPGGLEVGTAWHSLKAHLGAIGGITVVVFDEVDRLGPEADRILYNFTRVNHEISPGKVAVVGISNRLEFLESLDPRAASSLGQSRVVFPPYGAPQLADILFQRVESCFKDGAVDGAVVRCVAAVVASEGGDARRALELLLFSGEEADAAGDSRVTEDHLARGFDRVETTATEEVIQGLSVHMRLALEGAIAAVRRVRNRPADIGEVYEDYCRIAQARGVRPLVPRRVSDFIYELHGCGILNAPIAAEGRAGRRRVVSLRVTEDVIRKGLAKAPEV